MNRLLLHTGCIQIITIIVYYNIQQFYLFDWEKINNESLNEWLYELEPLSVVSSKDCASHLWLPSIEFIRHYGIVPSLNNRLHSCGNETMVSSFMHTLRIFHLNNTIPFFVTPTEFNVDKQLLAWSFSHIYHDAFILSNLLLKETPLPSYPPFNNTLESFNPNIRHNHTIYFSTKNQTFFYYNHVHLLPLPLIYSYVKYFDQFLEEDRVLHQAYIQSGICWAWTHLRQSGIQSPEINPLNGLSLKKEWSGLPLTLIDSLDTLWVAGFQYFFDEGIDWLHNHLNFDINTNVNVFETTIRILGGLLSTYYISKDTHILDQATDLGYKLLKAFPSKILYPTNNQTIEFKTQIFDSSHYCDLLKLPSTAKAQCITQARNFTFTELPSSDITLLMGEKTNLGIWSSLAEVGSLQLEFIMLSLFTGQCEFHDSIDAVMELLESSLNIRKIGIVPTLLDPNNPKFIGPGPITIGSRGDSFYEYIIKEWILTGTKDQLLKDMIISFIVRLKQFLLKSTPLPFHSSLKSGISTSDWEKNYGPRHGDIPWTKPVLSPIKLDYHKLPNSSKIFWIPNYEVDHLVCFLPGVLGLLLYHNPPIETESVTILDIAEKMMLLCVSMYFRTTTGLAPEITVVHPESGMDDDASSKFSLIRPETIESLFILHRVTGNPQYRHWGWRIATSIFQIARAPYGFASIMDVQNDTKFQFGSLNWKGVQLPPRQHSWVFSETLKYLYLLFTDDWELEDRLDLISLQHHQHLIPTVNSTHSKTQKNILNRVLFSTEAHMFPYLSESTLLCGRMARLNNTKGHVQ